MKNLPNFIIIGTQKGGTTALAKNLANIPNVFIANHHSIDGEPHFFNDQWERGVAWYQSLFITDKQFIGEKTPNYLSCHESHSRMASVVPDAKLIILLRNPIDRAYSAWNHFNQMADRLAAQGWEMTDFETAIFDRHSNIHKRLLFNSHYIDHINNLLKYFKREQMHFVISERLRKDPVHEFQKTLDFIGVDTKATSFINAHQRKYPEPMSKEIRARLEKHFKDYNKRLFDFLGEEIHEWKTQDSKKIASKINNPPLIFMISSGRSGTHAIRSILNQFDHLKVYEETFNQDMQRQTEGDFTRFLDRLIKINSDWSLSAKFADEAITKYFEYLKSLSSNKTAVIDIKDEQLRLLDWPVIGLNKPPRLLNHIIKSGMPILRFTRKNRLAQCCSLMIAQRTGVWSVSNKQNITEKQMYLTINKEDLLRDLEGFEKSEELIDQWTAGLSQLTKFNYEDSFINGAASDHLKLKIKDHLGLEISENIPPSSVKIVNGYQKYIINFDEVTEWLKDTPFRKYLDMPE